ncbi:uncharacterized protein EV420DRAFT_694447 [Desarmillaria tabescens]|uniref:Uncharacterized protein n=1 Tax=Armillaria tabescens TaxID=1929756 RepID=A0AA39K083_ARMTA|nr:uncharacterized protein EV420DRAFT_694447 [Desarmillaria tabescens]KAK0452155.1 hypothetical protein EV420DRAFT_694447 [Desarmillaria tabescens]
MRQSSKKPAAGCPISRIVCTAPFERDIPHFHLLLSCRLFAVKQNRDSVCYSLATPLSLWNCGTITLFSDIFGVPQKESTSPSHHRRVATGTMVPKYPSPLDTLPFALSRVSSVSQFTRKCPFRNVLTFRKETRTMGTMGGVPLLRMPISPLAGRDLLFLKIILLPILTSLPARGSIPTMLHRFPFHGNPCLFRKQIRSLHFPLSSSTTPNQWCSSVRQLLLYVIGNPNILDVRRNPAGSLIVKQATYASTPTLGIFQNHGERIGTHWCQKCWGHDLKRVPPTVICFEWYRLGRLLKDPLYLLK